LGLPRSVLVSGLGRGPGFAIGGTSSVFRPSDLYDPARRQVAESVGKEAVSLQRGVLISDGGRRGRVTSSVHQLCWSGTKRSGQGQSRVAKIV